MIAALLTLLLGIVVILAIITANGYFVAQEFAYMSVDRTRLGARAEAGDKAAQRALKVTRRTSFMLSGAQLGITVTGLLIGYVAEPLVGESLAVLLGEAGIPAALSISVGTVIALVVAAVVQMIFGELYPKNLAIANREVETPGVVHVRDTLLEPPGRPVRELSRPAFVLEADTPVYEALARIRQAGEQLAAVRHDGRFVGVIALSDVLRRVLPLELTRRASRADPGPRPAETPPRRRADKPGDALVADEALRPPPPSQPASVTGTVLASRTTDNLLTPCRPGRTRSSGAFPISTTEGL